MKEPFIDLDTLIDQTKLLGDMELQAYLGSLNDSQRSEFMSDNVAETINTVNNQKSARFTDLIDQATGADNNVTSAAYYLARTRDLTSFTKDVDDMTVAQLNVRSVNKGLAGRQHEINEWANLNKLDTLYFMQVLFISLSFVSLSIFFYKNGAISPPLFSFICYSVGIMALLMLILRWRFTRVKRDHRYWHKERFVKPRSAMKDSGSANFSNNSTCQNSDNSNIGAKSGVPISVPLVVL
jgi:hypothetical protein